VKGNIIAPLQVPCSTGNTPVGGGFELINTGAELSVLFSAPVKEPLFTGWRVIVRNLFGQQQIQNAQVRVWVVCGKASS
jgi:energy-converting hydrogenase Eha subunit A